MTALREDIPIRCITTPGMRLTAELIYETDDPAAVRLSITEHLTSTRKPQIVVWVFARDLLRQGMDWVLDCCPPAGEADVKIWAVPSEHAVYLHLDSGQGEVDLLLDRHTVVAFVTQICTAMSDVEVERTVLDAADGYLEFLRATS